MAFADVCVSSCSATESLVNLSKQNSSLPCGSVSSSAQRRFQCTGTLQFISTVRDYDREAKPQPLIDPIIVVVASFPSSPTS